MTLPTSPADMMKQRLREDLKAAMRQRQSEHTATLRTLIAALDNAEAVPVEAGHDRYALLDFGGPGAEAPRRVLTHAEVLAVLQRERDERESAALEMRRIGRTDAGQVLADTASFVTQYLSD